ncbi:MAG: LamG domain-containing protein [Anaerolineales bacterium]|nr:LamG domain-containing protein [Anaerolineales bacterium]
MSLTKPTLDNLRATGTTTGDVYFPQTKLLLPFNGTNGATATDDLSNLNNAVTFGGNASISTARSKFGGSSCHFDGTGDYVDVGGTYWTTGAAIDSGDFTIEFWLNIDAWGGNTSQSLITNYGTNTGGWALYVSVSSGKLYWWHHNGSAWVYLNLNQGTRTALSLDTWYHAAVTRSGSTFRLFLNGTQEDSMTDSNAMSSSDAGVQNGIRLGAVNAALQYPVNGYLSDLRITKGVARYTSNFTAPTTALPTSAGDINKQILINSTADGVAIGTAGINQARIAKAWADIDGTQTAANQIESSYNISSMTDHGSAQFSFNFATAMADANYSVVGGVGIDGGGATSVAALLIKDKTTALVKMHARYVAGDGSSNDYDYNIICMQVFGN